MADDKGEPPQPPPPPPQSSRPKVKSYLHKFYDRSQPAVKDPALSEPEPAAADNAAAAAAAAAAADEESELRRLLSGGGGGHRSKQSGCHLRPVVWKAMLWIGVNCLIFGALGLAIAFFLPHEPEFVEVPGAQGFVRSRSNADWNRSASILKYVALGVFGIGAAVTAAGLVLPSLVWRLFDEDVSGSGGPMTTDSCSSRCRRRQQPRQPPHGGTTRTTTTTSASVPAAAAAVAAATTGAAPPTEAPPALSSLVDERPVQPARGPEGHVSHGQVK